MTVDTESGVVTGTELAVQTAEPTLSMGPVIPIAEMAKMLKQLQDFIDTQLILDTDYGLIPGAKQKSLQKPGAEKFTFWFGLGIEYVHVAGEVTASRVSHTYGCRLTSLATGKIKAYVERSCNSDEENMQKAHLALEAKGYADIRAIDNTVRGMAQKRALVAATLVATMASGFLAAHEGGEDERRELGLNGGEQPNWCSIHKSKMHRREKDGKAWYSHKLPDGSWCNGPKKEKAEASAASQPAEAGNQPDGEPEATKASTPAVPATRGALMNRIQARREELGWGPMYLTNYVKTNFMRASLTACTDDELGKLMVQMAEARPEEAMNA